MNNITIPGFGGMNSSTAKTGDTSTGNSQNISMTMFPSGISQKENTAPVSPVSPIMPAAPKEMWTCNLCGEKENDATDKFCTGCGAKRGAMPEDSEQNSDSNEAAEEVVQNPDVPVAPEKVSADSESGEWVCSNCGTAHPDNEAFCTTCGSSRYTEEPKVSKAVADVQVSEGPSQETGTPAVIPEEAVSEPVPGEWVCSNCGTVHPDNEAFCTTCGSARHTEKAKADKAPEKAEEKASEPEVWICGCGTINDVDNNFCKGCGKPKAEKKEGKSEAVQENPKPVVEKAPESKPQPAPQPQVQKPVQQPKPPKTKEQQKSSKSTERQNSINSLLLKSMGEDSKKESESSSIAKLINNQSDTADTSVQSQKETSPVKEAKAEQKQKEPSKGQKPAELDKNPQPVAGSKPEKSVETTRQEKKEPEAQQDKPRLVQMVKEAPKRKEAVPAEKDKPAEPSAVTEVKKEAPVNKATVSTAVDKNKARLTVDNIIGRKLQEYSKKPGRIVEVSLTSGMYLYFSNETIEYVSVPQSNKKSHIIPIGPMIEVTDQCIIVQNPFITDKPYGVIKGEHICNMIDIDNIRDEEAVIAYSSIAAITVKRLPQYIIKENDCFTLKS